MTKIVRSILYTGLLLNVLNSCNKTAYNPQSLPVHTIPAADTLHDLRHMIDSVPSTDLFLLALQRTGYDTLLSQTSAFYTLMIPTDSLLIASGYTKDVINNLYPPVIASGIILNQIWNGQISDSVLDGADGYVQATALANTYSVAKQGGPTGGLWVNAVQVSSEKSGTWASNGYIHVANAFYHPPASNAWTILQTHPEFSYFVAACRIDDSVVATLGTSPVYYVYGTVPDSTIFLNISNFNGNFPFTNYTYFVPTNQAFINAGFNTIDDIRNYELTYTHTFNPSAYTVSPLDTLIYSHFLPNTNLYYYDLLKNPNLNGRDAADLKPTTETELYNISYNLNTDPYNQGYPTVGLEYPFKGILNYQVTGNTVTITCNSTKHPPAATVVEHDIVCTNSVILHGVDHLFWPW